MSVANQGAPFGALTPSSAGGFKPLDNLNAVVALTAVTNQTGATRTWSIASGALIANGTPSVDDTIAITCSHAGGSVILTIASIADGYSVSTDAELVTAITATASSGTGIYLRPGAYTFDNGGAAASGVFNAQDRTTNPTTVQSHTTDNKAVFSDSTCRLNGSDFWTFKDFDFTGSSTWTGISGGGPNVFDDYNGCNNVTFDNITITGPVYSDAILDDATPDTDGIPYPIPFNFGQINTHSISVKNCTLTNVWEFGDFIMSGTMEITNNTVVRWYFDGLRMIAPSGGGTPGAKVISDLHLSSNVAVYDELGGSAPHPDGIQAFNDSGGSNYSIDDLLVKNCVIMAGGRRNNNAQGFLTQSTFKNLAIVECLIIPNGSPHGITFETDSDGILISNVTIGVYSGSGSPWIRLYNQQGQVIVNSTVFPVYSVLSNTGDYELDQVNNNTGGTDMSLLYQNPDNQTTIAGALAGYAPIVSGALDTGIIGALTTSGAWRGLAYPPRQAAVPTLTPAAKSLIVNYSEPVDDGGGTSPTYDLRYRLTSGGAGSAFTETTGISSTQSITGLTALASYDVQTRKVTSAGDGLWSVLLAASTLSTTITRSQAATSALLIA